MHCISFRFIIVPFFVVPPLPPLKSMGGGGGYYKKKKNDNKSVRQELCDLAYPPFLSFYSWLRNSIRGGKCFAIHFNAR